MDLSRSITSIITRVNALAALALMLHRNLFLCNQHHGSAFCMRVMR